MAQSSFALTLGDVSVRQFDGLFSLNDLHRASGNAEKHKPALFLRNQQTQALIEEIDRVANSQLGAGKQDTNLHLALKVVHGGLDRGTYACRELVIAFAAWISAAFHLKVIRVFLAAADEARAAAAPKAEIPALPRNAQFHSDTVGRLNNASCRLGIALELAERMGMETDGSEDPAETLCTNAWAIAYLVEDGQRHLGDAIRVLSPLTMPRSGLSFKPTTPAPEAVFPTTPIPSTPGAHVRDQLSPSPDAAASGWTDEAYAEALLRSFRLRITEVFNLSVKSPDQVEQMHRLGVIGDRQIAKLRRLMIEEPRQ